MDGKTLDFIRMIFDAAGIPFVLIGTPKIRSLIATQEQFASRVMAAVFPVLEEVDILNDFLPNLKIENWKFDGNNEAHVELGKKLWNSVRPSLRRLVAGIETATKLSAKSEEPMKFQDVIELAIFTANSIVVNGLEDDEPSNPDPDPDTFEGQSEIRHINKNKRKKNN